MGSLRYSSWKGRHCAHCSPFLAKQANLSGGEVRLLSMPSEGRLPPLPGEASKPRPLRAALRVVAALVRRRARRRQRRQWRRVRGRAAWRRRRRVRTRDPVYRTRPIVVAHAAARRDRAAHLKVPAGAAHAAVRRKHAALVRLAEVAPLVGHRAAAREERRVRRRGRRRTPRDAPKALLARAGVFVAPFRALAETTPRKACLQIVNQSPLMVAEHRRDTCAVWGAESESRGGGVVPGFCGSRRWRGAGPFFAPRVRLCFRPSLRSRSDGPAASVLLRRP